MKNVHSITKLNTFLQIFLSFNYDKNDDIFKLQFIKLTKKALYLLIIEMISQNAFMSVQISELKAKTFANLYFIFSYYKYLVV